MSTAPREPGAIAAARLRQADDCSLRVPRHGIDAPGSQESGPTLPEAPVRELLARARERGARRAVVVRPIDELSLGSALEARKAGLLHPILVGEPQAMERAAHALGASLEGVTIVPAEGEQDAAERAIALLRGGEASFLVKGVVHSDTLLSAMLDKKQGLRAGSRLSHVFACYLPARLYPKPLLITDAVVNVAPDLDGKRDITQNAIDLAHALGIGAPKVAILAAVETVNPAMQATLDAAALCKMAERGQIRGATVEGPLAFDNAVSAEAARIKGIKSTVPGSPDILVVPNIEAGNIAVKQLTYFASAITPGLVLGARSPVVLTSRADPPLARIASCAIASLLI